MTPPISPPISTKPKLSNRMTTKRPTPVELGSTDPRTTATPIPIQTPVPTMRPNRGAWRIAAGIAVRLSSSAEGTALAGSGVRASLTGQV